MADVVDEKSNNSESEVLSSTTTTTAATTTPTSLKRSHHEVSLYTVYLCLDIYWLLPLHLPRGESGSSDSLALRARSTFLSVPSLSCPRRLFVRAIRSCSLALPLLQWYREPLPSPGSSSLSVCPVDAFIYLTRNNSLLAILHLK